MSEGRGFGGNREVSPLCERRGDPSGAGAEAIPKEGSEPKASDDHSISREKWTSVEPSVNVSPSLNFARLTRLPLTSIPLVEPRSTIQ